MNKVKMCVIGGMVLFLLGLGVGRYTLPTKSTETEKHATETEKEVIDREKHNADGSTEKEHIVRDIKKEIKEIARTVDNAKTSWKASALVGYSLDNKRPVYGIDVQRRILGNAHIGLWGTTEKTLGLSIGYEF